jgi:hypothetical protein
VLCFCLGACGVVQTPHLKDGKPYGVTQGPFRDKWWNYYERGTSFAGGGFAEEALRDFQAAIALRAEDQWRTRTYGMHFLDYFPHRELGILHYRRQQHEDAIRELETSLSSASSAKAAYYLNRARAALLERTGRDLQPPALRLSGPRDASVTSAFHATLSGVATDDQFVSAVSVNGAPLLLEQSIPRFEFETRVPLHEGPNEIRVRAVDLTDKESATSLTLTADRRGPLITVVDLAQSGTRVHLNGVITDDSGIVRYTINGKVVPADREEEILLDEELAPGPVRIEAVDRAGNVTTAEVAPARKASLPLAWPRFASLGTPPPGSLHARHAGSRSGRLSARILDLFDSEPPAITLRDLPASLETFQDRILIEGNAADAGTVASLTVNGAKVLRRGGKTVFFSHLLGLAVGQNRIEIEATDSRGNTRTREIVVERKVPPIRQLGSRMSIAMLTLEHRGAASVAGAALNDRLISAFVGQKRFNLVEREKIRDVLTELELSGSQLADPATAPRIGRIVAADTILSGAVAETDRAIEVVTHLIDTESAVILATNDAFDEAKDLAAVDALAERLAFKYQRDFPLLEGRIIDASGSNILVDLGTEHGLKPHRKLILFRTGASTDPATSVPSPLGEAKVSEVFPGHSDATVTRRDAEFRASDGVLTK